MQAIELNLDILSGTIEKLDAYVAWKDSDPKTRYEALYNRMMVNHFRDLLTAKEQGKKIVGYTVACPTELIYANDMIPMSVEWTGNAMVTVLGLQPEAYQAARSYGFKSEICTLHRGVNGAILKGWVPAPDANVWSNMSCDNTAKCGDFVDEFYGVPGFFLDRTSRNTTADFNYYLSQFEDLLEFLENVNGRKMDWDRFREVMEISHRSAQLVAEIQELRKAIPHPVPPRYNLLVNYALNFPGSADQLAFYEHVFNEAQENVRRGVGAIPNETYRLLTVSYSPTYSNKVVDWMAEEYGAVFVADPIFPYSEAAFEYDPDKPLESLARKNFSSNAIAINAVTLRESDIVPRAIRMAHEYQADGMLFWAYCSCRTANPCLRPLKDALMGELGLPMAVVDLDLFDPTYKTEDQLKDEIEGFFEILEARK